MSETVTLKVSLDNPCCHPTMGKSCSPYPNICFTDSNLALPKAIISENNYISLEGARYIHVFDKEGGFIKYTDGWEARLSGEKNVAILRKLLILAALQADKKPEPPREPKPSKPIKEADKEKTPSLFYPLLRFLEAIVIGVFFGFGFFFGIYFAARFV